MKEGGGGCYQVNDDGIVTQDNRLRQLAATWAKKVDPVFLPEKQQRFAREGEAAETDAVIGLLCANQTVALHLFLQQILLQEPHRHLKQPENLTKDRRLARIASGKRICR